jgi:hypothetical protein
VLKAKYFPCGNLLDTVVSGESSATWKAIEYGLELLKKGVVWRVADGSDIRIWRDNWLPRPYSMKPIGSLRHCRLRRVEHLIDQESRTWDEAQVMRFFYPCDVEEILKIKLSASRGADEIAWNFEKTGMFTVRSAYTRSGTRITTGGHRAFNHSLHRAQPTVVAVPSGPSAGATTDASPSEPPAGTTVTAGPSQPLVGHFLPICIHISNVGHCNNHGWTVVVQVPVTECLLPATARSHIVTGKQNRCCITGDGAHGDLDGLNTSPFIVAGRHRRCSSSLPPTRSASTGTIAARRWEPASSFLNSSIEAGPSAPQLHVVVSATARHRHMISTGHRHLPNDVGGHAATAFDTEA